MFGYMNLHAIAAARGDGLKPELLALLERRRGIALPSNVVALPLERQWAGPGPSGAGMTGLPAGVLAFPARTNFDKPAKRKI